MYLNFRYFLVLNELFKFKPYVSRLVKIAMFFQLNIYQKSPFRIIVKESRKPKILMIHRISTVIPIDKIYYFRNLVTPKERLMKIIESLIGNGVHPGSIKETLQDENKFHLSFDDGYREHLKIAKELKRVFSLKNEHCTFSINIGNSILEEYSGMDLIYEIISSGNANMLCEYLRERGYEFDLDIESIKEKYLALHPDEIKELIERIEEDDFRLKKLYLDRDQIKNLSKLFNVASHGISHRDLRKNIKISDKEISNSKKILEDIIGSEVEIMCYPEGKNNEKIRKITKDSGYKFGLSIDHEKDDPFCIGRYCINRELEKFLGGI